MYMCAGVAFFASARQTFRSIHFPSPQQATAQPFTNESVEALKAEERRETPPFVRENAERAHGLAEHLLKDFGPRIRIEVVGLDSPRGVWLGIRHGVGKGFAVIVDGNAVFRNSDDYDSVKQAVDRAILAHESLA